jgi:hypothetical protein
MKSETALMQWSLESKYAAVFLGGRVRLLGLDAFQATAGMKLGLFEKMYKRRSKSVTFWGGRKV